MQCDLRMTTEKSKGQQFLTRTHFASLSGAFYPLFCRSRLESLGAPTAPLASLKHQAKEEPSAFQIAWDVRSRSALSCLRGPCAQEPLRDDALPGFNDSCCCRCFFCSDSNELGACYHTGVQCAAGGLDDGDEFVGGSRFEVEAFVGGQSGYRVVSQAVL